MYPMLQRPDTSTDKACRALYTSKSRPNIEYTLYVILIPMAVTGVATNFNDFWLLNRKKNSAYMNIFGKKNKNSRLIVQNQVQWLIKLYIK